MAVRTAELDARIHEAVFGSADLTGGEASPPITQLVIVGAGADMRAWRLPWCVCHAHLTAMRAATSPAATTCVHHVCERNC